MSHADRKGVLERSLANLTIGVAQSIRGRRDALRDVHTGEWDQQIQVPISGVAGGSWDYVDKLVQFDVALVPAKSQRPVPFDTPHFHCNFSFEQASDALVICHGHVIRWTINDFGWYVGAMVRFAVSAPNLTPITTAAPVAFSAVAHLTFQGYGSLPEQQEFQQ